MFIQRGRNIILYWACFLLIMGFAVYNGFWNLDNGIVYDWDEARQGVNAYEMLESGNYIVNTFGGETDYWNLKPPLSFWQTALSFRIFGYNALGLRFFSALWLPVMVLSAMLFLRKYSGPWASLSGGAVLACLGMRFHHLFRTGDPDSLFFMCCFFACMFLYFSYKKSFKYLIGTGLFAAFAFLSKAMHVFPLLLVLLLSLLLLRKTCSFGWKKITCYLLLPMALPVCIWAIARFLSDGTAFFRYMFELDVWNRVTSTVENHSGGFSYYIVVLSNLLGGFLVAGILLTMTLALFYAATKTEPRAKSKASKEPVIESRGDSVFFVIYGLMALIPFAVFTISKTKLGWYIYPCMIGVVFLTAWAIQSFANDFADKNQRRAAMILGTLCMTLLLVGVVWRPFNNIDLKVSTGFSSESNIFIDLSDSQHKDYFIIDENGGESSVSQSWLLHSIFLGMTRFPGDYDRYAQYNEENPGTLLIVSYSNPETLNAFESAHPALKLIAQKDAYAAFANDAR